MAACVLTVIQICSAEGRILALHIATLVLVALLMDFVVAFRKLHFMDARCSFFTCWLSRGRSHWLATIAGGRSPSSVGTPTILYSGMQ